MPRAKSTTATGEKKTTTRAKKTVVATNGNGNEATQVTGHLTEEQIRQRAYELYERRGRRDGSHEADWYTAEAELRSRTA